MIHLRHICIFEPFVSIWKSREEWLKYSRLIKIFTSSIFSPIDPSPYDRFFDFIEISAKNWGVKDLSFLRLQGLRMINGRRKKINVDNYSYEFKKWWNISNECIYIFAYFKYFNFVQICTLSWLISLPNNFQQYPISIAIKHFPFLLYISRN